jgi:hypothetical protein
MPDELDARLLRHFAENYQPLVDARFVAQVTERMGVAQGARLSLGALRSVPASIVSGLRTGLSATLRLRHAGLMFAVAVAVTVWAAFA